MSLSKEDLSLGDHIYVKRLLYSHHGIYAGDGKVIHYTGEEKEEELFTTYCATGKKKSNQVRKAAVGFLGVTLAAAGTIIRIRKPRNARG